MWTDRPAMTIAVDLGRKATKQNTCNYFSYFRIDTIEQNIFFKTVERLHQWIYVTGYTKPSGSAAATKFCVKEHSLFYSVLG